MADVKAKYSERVEAMVPGGGKGVDLPSELLDAWADMKVQKESPSSFASFLECPTKWFVERHLGPLHEKTGKTILGITDFTRQPANQWGVGGSLAHRALEVLYTEPPGFRTREVLEDIYDHAWDCLKAGDIDDGIVSKSLVTEWESVLANLTDPPKSFKSFFRTTYRDLAWAIFDMETPPRVNVLANEQIVRLQQGRLNVFGKIDRTDRTLNGLEKIVDYKTGKNPTGEVSVFNKTFLPSGIYALARHRARADNISALPVAGVQLVYLKSGERFSIKATPEMYRDVEEVLDMIGNETAAIADRGYVPTSPAASKDDAPCRFCKIRDLCPDWNE